MALSIIGGSNFLGRYLIRSLYKDYPETRLADMYPYRDSVYALQAELDLPLVKHSLVYQTGLSYALEGAKTAIFVTHDYFKLAHSKNFLLERTAAFAKAAGVERLIWVAPLEFTQLNSLDGDPESLVSEAESKAKELFPELSVLRTNLVFGPSASSLLLAHAIDAIKHGQNPVTTNNGQSRFQPVHHDEVLNAVKQLKPGESHIISGPEVLTWIDITRVLAGFVGKETPDHGSSLDSLKTMLATNDYIGDIFYPSHLQQFYRLLTRDQLPNPSIKGNKTMKETYQKDTLDEFGTYHWHRVSVD